MPTLDRRIRRSSRQKELDTEEGLRAFANQQRRLGASFVAFYVAMVDRVSAALRVQNSLQRDIVEWRRQRRIDAGECGRCNNRGTVMVHVPSDRAMLDTGIRTCSACDGTPPPCTAPLDVSLARSEAGRRLPGTPLQIAAYAASLPVFEDRCDAAGAESRAANKSIAPWSEAASIGCGSHIILDNPKARPVWTHAQDNPSDPPKRVRVPVGTAGEVIGRSHSDEDFATNGRVHIRAKDGRSFWTSASNISTISQNGWERFLGIDDFSVAAARKANADAGVKASEDAEGITLSRGDKVYETKPNGKRVRVSVFWVGPERATGRQRYGAGKTAKDGPWWGYSSDAARV